MQNLNPLTQSDFIIKSGSLPIFIFQMLTAEMEFFISQLDKLFREKEFSQNTLIALDLQKLVDDTKVDFMLLKQTFALNNLTLVGIIGGTEQQRIFAVKCGLHLLPSSRNAINRKAKSEEPRRYLPTEVISNTVRSGQRIYAKNRDLICVATINPGAEIIADGNIHVYGKLSGRALAGARGDKEASIFCINCDAELISIAGLYHADTNLRIPSETPIQIYLTNEELQVRRLIQ